MIRTNLQPLCIFRYAALGMGIVNTFGNLPGMILPSIVAAMTPTVRQKENCYKSFNKHEES